MDDCVDDYPSDVFLGFVASGHPKKSAILRSRTLCGLQQQSAFSIHSVMTASEKRQSKRKQ